MVEREGGSIWRYYSLTRVHLLVPDEWHHLQTTI